MSIKIVDDLPPVSGAGFGAELRGDGLHLPRDIGAVLRRNNVHSAEELIACARSFPSLFESELGWSLQDVQHAVDELAASLQGKLPDEILNPKAPPPRVYGARPPGKDRG